MSQMVDINPHRRAVKEQYLTDDMAVINPKLAAEFNTRMEDVVPHAVLAEQRLELNEDHERLRVISGLMYALRKSGTHLAWAEFQQKSAKHRRKQAEAVAALDNVLEYAEMRKAEGKETKLTDSTRNYYVAMDPSVDLAFKEEMLADAMVSTFSVLISQFSEALRILRAAFYKSKEMESLGTLSSATKETI